MARAPDTADVTEPAPLLTGLNGAWTGFLRAHAMLARRLDAELQARHDLTLNDYDVLVQLRDSEAGHLRMSDVASRVVLTRSGITRLVDGLQRDGLVARSNCPTDARSVYACITDVGRARLAEAAATHRSGIREAFGDHFSEAELALLTEQFERLISGVQQDCGKAGADCVDALADPGC